MHDRNGNEIKVGDTVSVDFVVSTIYPDTDYCNVSLKTTAGRKVDGSNDYFTTTADLTRLVDRAPPPPAPPQAPASTDDETPF